jgi:hypothetical protein
MIVSGMFKLIKFVFLALVIQASPAFSTPISYVVDIDWDSDGVAGGGTDLFIDLSGPVSEGLTVYSVGAGNLRRFQFSVFGVTFTAADDEFAPSTPTLR